VRADVGTAIAERAVELVGIPFRLRGRSIAAGLDCVGVVAHALGGTASRFDIPRDYTIRGDYLARISAFFGRDCFCEIGIEPSKPGDILLCKPSDRQVHFAIETLHGVVHAHTGLHRVVLTPRPLIWPVICRWRYIGD
jgi:hypothetical protein